MTKHDNTTPTLPIVTAWREEFPDDYMKIYGRQKIVRTQIEAFFRKWQEKMKPCDIATHGLIFEDGIIEGRHIEGEAQHAEGFEHGVVAGIEAGKKMMKDEVFSAKELGKGLGKDEIIEEIERACKGLNIILPHELLAHLKAL